MFVNVLCETLELWRGGLFQEMFQTLISHKMCLDKSTDYEKGWLSQGDLQDFCKLSVTVEDCFF